MLQSRSCSSNIGALETVTRSLSSWLEVIGTIDIFNIVQKACMFVGNCKNSSICTGYLRLREVT